FQAEDGIRDFHVTGVQTCALPISVNFARDWQSANPSAKSEETAQEGDSASPPRIYFKQMAIDGGRLLFRDFTQDQAAEFQVAPLDLTVSDLATWPRGDDDSRYSFIAALGSQTIEWDGELSVRDRKS